MTALSAQELLEVWERCIYEKPFQRALLMISAACPEIALESLPALSLGQRDALLLSLRKAIFGTRIVGIANCKGCSERLEIDFNMEEIAQDLPSDPSEVMMISSYGFDVSFRLPNSSDLMAASDKQDLVSFRDYLLKRCLLKVARGTGETSFEELPEALVDKIAAMMGKADPQADVRIALTCPKCGGEGMVAFDIVSFLWSELNAWAIRTLREVHILASAYGWHEADILAMSPWRRQFYLEVLER